MMRVYQKGRACFFGPSKASRQLESARQLEEKRYLRLTLRIALERSETPLMG